MSISRIIKNYLGKKTITVNKSILKFGECFYLLFKDFEEPLLRSQVIQTLIATKRRPSETLVEKNHPAFGILSSHSYSEVKKMLFYLVGKRCLTVFKKGSNFSFLATTDQLKLMQEVDYSNFPNFQLPENEFDYLVNLSQPLPKKLVIFKPEKEKVEYSKEEEILLSELRDLRKKIAKGLQMPVYFVMQNKTLEQIVKQRPQTKEEMIQLDGMGEIRFSKYGIFFLEKTIEFANVKSENKIEKNEYDTLFNKNKFISKSAMINFFNLVKSGDINLNTKFQEHFQSIEELDLLRENHNKKYVSQKLETEKEYLESILKEVDEKINLDAKQREVILRDEDYTLVVAGAGSGKTTTVAAKVKYLVEKQNISPEDILIVSYTNDAVNELKTRINKNLNIPAKISTFHKVGFAIVRKQKDADKMQIAHEGIVFNVIRDYLKNLLKSRPEDLKSMILFFGYYIDAPIGADTLEGFINHFQRHDYTTLKENLREITNNIIEEKTKKKVSIKEEVMRSIEEVQIANFLYLHEIDYSYEEVYPYHIVEAKKLYTPDFTIRYKDTVIYLEHFGISESGLNNRYNDEQLETYKKQINDKVLLHREKNTKLIYTFSNYNDGRSIIDHLTELLENQGIHIVERPIEEVYKKIIDDEDNKYFTKLIFLIKDFISSFKINGYTESDFSELETKTDNVRNKLFLKIVKPIYLHYQSTLLENDMLDFADMINESARILSNPDIKDLIPDFKYVIVDEYQDISMQRFNLTEALSKATNAKIIAVGDDWQSIFAFAGSRIDLFLKFKDMFGYADYLTIDYTYRNAQQLIDTAGKFIQENNMQLKKQLKSPKNIEFPIIMYEYNDLAYKNESKGYKGIVYEKAKLCDEIFKELVNEFGQKQTIALLGRYNFELEKLATTEFFEFDYKNRIRSTTFPNLKLKFMTIHASKGLGFDNVIILNGSDEVFGFPSQLEMDPILKLVKYDDRTISYAEERRLFYVALTRTKNKVYLLYPKTKPSDFVKELTKGYSTVRYPKSISQNIPLQDRKDKRCPICGYPLQFKHNKAYGLKLYMCTNEPEICGYITNNLRSGKKSVSKCPDCKTGFLIVKRSQKNDNYFFGCTNYKDSGTGCNHVESITINKD